jgi:hypothetical protein
MQRMISFDIGVRNLAYAVLERTGNSFRVISWRCIDTLATGSRGTHQDSIVGVLAALDALSDELLECSTVLIEAQPRFAPLNSAIAHAVCSYFLIRKRIDLSEPVSVHFVSAKLKNRLVCVKHTPRVSVKTGKPVSDRYARYACNKKSAVTACETLVTNSGSPALIEFWTKFPKKDDAADALLQAIAWSNIGIHEARLIIGGSLPKEIKP